MAKLRFALVGTGNIAHQHVEAILACGQELVAVCNHNIEKAMLFLSSYSGREGVAPAALEETVFSSVAEMLDQVKPDVLYVTTPHLTHVDVACQAVMRGIHCIIEKPLDISLAKAQFLQEASERSGAIVSVISQSRFFKPTERIKQAIDDGKLGTPAFGVVNVLAWRDEAYYRSNTWRGTWAYEGGGVLVNQSVHELDLLCYFLGEVESVYGIWRNINHPYIEVDDTAQAIVTFKSGATATIIVSNSVNPAQDAYVHIVGSNGNTVGIKTHGGVEIEAGIKPSSFHAYNDVFTLEDEDTLKQYRQDDYAGITEKECPYYFFAKQVQEMVHAVQSKRDGIKVHLRNNIASAQGCMRIFQGIYLSQQLGRPVTVKEIIDHSMAELAKENQPKAAPAAAPAALKDEAQAAAATATPSSAS